MGNWGTKLYEDDLALDIKEQYIEKLKQGIENKKALEEIIKENQETIKDVDEAPIFWITLAHTMWSIGRLTNEVKEKALNQIDNNLKKWKEEASAKDYEKRKIELEKLKEKLEAQMPKEKIMYVQKSEKTKNTKRKYEWNIGDVYAYKLESEKAKELGLYGRYLVFRKTKDGIFNKKTIGAVVYTQITQDANLPKSKQDLEKLEYVVITNEGNVRHKYQMEIYKITQKVMKEKLKYIGNYLEIDTPIDEYKVKEVINIKGWPWKYIDTYFLENAIKLGTNKHPVYYEIDPRNINDSHIRFLMRVRYYEKKLGIIPPDGAIVKNDPLLYISLVDSMMIGGIVDNPVGIVNEEMKQEAYRRIKKLKEIIINKNDEKKEEKLKILEELREKIEKYQYENPFLKFLNNN